jgi:hypothetical protein
VERINAQAVYSFDCASGTDVSRGFHAAVGSSLFRSLDQHRVGDINFVGFGGCAHHRHYES